MSEQKPAWIPEVQRWRHFAPSLARQRFVAHWGVAIGPVGIWALRQLHERGTVP